MPIVDGKLRVSIELGGFSGGGTVARSAMPSGFDATFVFGATLSASSTTTGLKLCTYNSTNKILEIPFEISSTARTNYILDIYAFENGTTINSSTDATSALFHGSTKISIPANSPVATLGDSVVKLLSNSASLTGTVELKITLPSSDYTLSCSDTRFTATTSAGVATITATIASGSYSVTLEVLKGSDVVYTRNETINVFPAMKSDVWLSGDGTSTQMLTIEMNEINSTFYVCGNGSTWFGDFGVTVGNDTTGNGSLAKPYATIQKAIEKIKATNDGTTEYKIYVDGTFTASDTTPVADFSGIGNGCSITLKGLDATNKATLDGNNAVQGIVAGNFDGTTETKVNLNLTLENLIITKCNGSRGGGILLVTTINNNHAISNCEISNNTATHAGGGIFIANGKLTLESGAISGNTARFGGGITNRNGTVTLNGGTIGNATPPDIASSSSYSNKATERGGAIYNGGGTIILSGGNISYNYAATYGGGICNASDSGSELIIGSSSTTTIKYNYCTTSGGGIYSENTFTMQAGVISNNKATNGGGIFINSNGKTTTVSGGTIKDNVATRAPSDGSGGQAIGFLDGTLELKDDAKIDSSNDIRLFKASTNPHLKITGDLTETETVATIWPTAYTSGTVVLEEDTGAGLVNTNYTKFEITPQSDGTEWGVNDEGKLFIKAISTADGGMYVNASTGNDANKGTSASPLKTLQEAATRIAYTSKASTDSYTINAIGTFTATDTTPLVDFSKVKSGCSVTLKGPASKATIDGNNNTAQGIVAGSFDGTNETTANLKLTLENLIVKKGKGTYGGGISLVTEAANSHTISNCEISGNTATVGGGIYNRKGKLTLESGTIEGNTASSGGGIGIYNGGTFEMSGGTIEGNTAPDGGGIYNYAIFTMSGGTISGNNSSNEGGGIKSYGTITIESGTISGNTALNGGSIYSGTGSKTKISGGTIKDNVATSGSSNGIGGHFIYVYNGTLELEGGAKIDSNNNIRLGGGAATLKITGNLTETETVATIWPNSYTVGATVLTADDASLISANYSKFTVSADAWHINSEGKLTQELTAAEAATFLALATSGSSITLKIKISEESDFSTVAEATKTTPASTVNLTFTRASNTSPTSISGFGTEGDSNTCKVTSVTLSEGFTSIGCPAFKWLRSLTSITLPSTLEIIGSSAFAGCKNLSSITIPASVTYIESWSFDASGLTSATFEDTSGWKKGGSSVTITNGSSAASLLKGLSSNSLSKN